jgi:hypothetical protein
MVIFIYFFFGKQSPYGPGTHSGKLSHPTHIDFVFVAIFVVVQPSSINSVNTANSPKSNFFITTPYKKINKVYQNRVKNATIIFITSVFVSSVLQNVKPIMSIYSF